jgi:hypothetical protein
MAENAIPHATAAILAFADKLHLGLVAIGAAIYMKQNTAATFFDPLEAARAADAAYNAAVAHKSACTAASATADDAARAYLSIYVEVLKPTLGRKWTEGWKDTGFASESLAIPDTMDGRQEAVRVAAAYLTAHATLENAPLGVTAVKAQECHDTLIAARAAVGAALADTTQKRAARDTALEALRLQIHGTINELSQLLAPDDGRWATFGLNMPAAPNRPEIPEHLIARAGPPGSGTAFIDWDEAARATRYRVYKQVTGVDSEFIAAVTVHDSAVTLADLPAGAEIKIRVTAANDTGETKPSDEVKVTLA